MAPMNNSNSWQLQKVMKIIMPKVASPKSEPMKRKMVQIL